MKRSQVQVQRLVEEKNILEKYFPGRVTWQNSRTLDTAVEIVMTSNSDRQYTLRVYVPEDYPNSCPQMVMVSPNLRLRNGSALPYSSSKFHTIGERDGHTIICHFIPEQWTQENTLYLVFMKGRLWIEGYEGHLKTGQDMDVFLKHQEIVVPCTTQWERRTHEEIATSFRLLGEPEVPQETTTVPPPCVLL